MRRAIGRVAALAALASVPAVHATEAGTWLGSGWNGQVPYAMRLQLADERGELKLGAPHACRVPLAHDGDGYVVGVSTAGGAVCDGLTGRRLAVRRDGQALRLRGLGTAELVLHPQGARAVVSDGARRLDLDEPGAGAVTLRVAEAALGERAGEWRQAGAASCRVVLELAAVGPERAWYVFTSGSSGGRCDRLVGGVVALDAASNLPRVRDGQGRSVALSVR